MDNLILRLKSICVYKSVAQRLAPLAALFACTDASEAVEKAAEVFSRVAESGADTTGEWINGMLIADDNVFSRTAARGERVPERLKTQVISELLTFKQLSFLKPDMLVTDETRAFFPRFGYGGMSASYESLVEFYAKNGCGKLATGNAFVIRNGEMSRAECGSVTLSDLKNYAEEKAEIVRNTENFIAGLPAFHTLLYGDRGTGKSTTVRAIARDYRDKLKVIELDKGDICRLSQIKAELGGLKQKYILFIDDLVFDEDESDADGFKSALEGSLDAPAGNTLLYCTSNRRHLFKEKDEQRARRNDDVQAELALFDRFGLVITYINPDKDEFVDILKQILRSRGIKWHDEYAAALELAALKKGGRSPRAAKQIADLIESSFAEKRGE